MRETKKITLPSGAELSIRTHLTAREVRELRLTKEKLMSFSVNVETGKPVLSEVNMASVQKDEEDCLIRFAVESYAGSTVNVLEALLDAPAGDFEATLLEARKLLESPKEAK